MNIRSTDRFSPRAEAYAANRPGYPEEALDALLAGVVKSPVVADIGAGTGISSRLLAQREAHVYAVEPNAEMRAQAEPDPSIIWINGTAESTGLGDKSVDLAAAFQAFHWFEPRSAIAEMRRISRQRIALLQYERVAAEDDTFTAAYAELVRRFAMDDTEARRMRALADFTELGGSTLRRFEYFYAQSLTLEQMLGRLASSSYLPQSGEAMRQMQEEAVAIFERFANSGQVHMTMVCYLLMADA